MRFALALALALLPLSAATIVRAQQSPKPTIDDDVQAFAISPSGAIAYAAPRIKHMKRLYIERDDIGISDGGKDRRIVDAEKFMPWPPPSGYVVNSMTWSPDGHKLALDLTLQEPPSGYEVATGKNKGKDQDDVEDRSPVSTIGGGRVVALLDDNGGEIKVSGSKSRFIEDAKNGAWLSDGQTVVYQPSGSNQINRVKPADGKVDTLFDSRSFQAIAWDTARDRAFAIGAGVRGQMTLMQLDLVHERITELHRVDNFQGELTVSHSGKKLAYFEDGDTIDAFNVSDPSRVTRVDAGYGRFEWSADEKRVLLKRGPEERSGYLVWVTLADGSFESVLHDLIFSQFQVTPDGSSIVVTEPGRRVLKVYPIQ